MLISRYALVALAVAILSLFGIARTDSSISRSPLVPGTTASYTAPNRVHVQVMREASSAYGAQQHGHREASAGLAATPLHPNSGTADRCGRSEQAALSATGTVSGERGAQQPCIVR